MDEMDTSSSTGSASEKLSEGEESPTSKGDVPEPMVGSPPLFTAIPSTSTMSTMITSEAPVHEVVHTEGWMSPKKDAMEGIPTDLTALTGKSKENYSVKIRGFSSAPRFYVKPIKSEGGVCFWSNHVNCVLNFTALPGTPSPQFVEHVTQSTDWFDQFKEEEQTWFVRMLLSRMHHHQHGSVNSYLKPMLQRDFITLLVRRICLHEI